MSLPQIDPLSQAIAGLFYPSESDCPFDLLPAQSNTNPRQFALAHARTKNPIQEISVDKFFSALQDSDDAPRFDNLRRTLESSLRNLQVFRVGSIEVDIYLVGQLPTGQWIALHTISVET